MFFDTTLADQLAAARFETHWDGIVHRLQNSTDPIVKESLLLGVHHEARQLVTVPRSSFRAHAHLLGPSNIGKSQLGVSPLMIQLIRMAGRDYCLGNPLQQSTIFVIDMKGDEALLQTAAIEARRAGLPFRLVTNNLGLPTFGFNPLYQKYLEPRDSLQRADTLQAGLRLEHGAGYGRDFYSTATLAGLLDFMKLYGNHCHSCTQLYPYVTGKLTDTVAQAAKMIGVTITSRDRDQLQALFHVLRILKEITILNVAPGDPRFSDDVVQHRVDMLDVCSRPQVLYFCLDSGTSQRASELIGGLALHCLYTAACQKRANRWMDGGDVEVPHVTYVFVDEFQRLVTESVSTVFDQARSAGLAIIAAHQNLGQLQFGDIDLSGSVVQSTGLKWTFGARTRDDIEALVIGSGEDISFVYDPYTNLEPGESLSLLDITETWHGVKPTRITRNDVIRLTANRNQSVIQISLNDGASQYNGLSFIMESAFPTTEAEYERRKRLTWPVSGEGTFIATSDLSEQLRQQSSVDQPPPHQAIDDALNRQAERRRRGRRSGGR